MLSTVRAITRRVIVGVSATTLALSALPAATIGQDAAEAKGPSISVDELIDLTLRAWNEDDRGLLDQVYAPDAVHTATYYDRTEVFEGVDRIASVAFLGSQINPVGERIDIPAPEGQFRWASFVDIGGGTACLWRAVDGKITRQDCVLPETFQGVRALFPAAEGGSAITVDELADLSKRAWNDNDRALFEQTWAPDAVHLARYLDTTKRYEGLDEIAKIAFVPGHIELIGPNVQLEAPDGELAWASVATVGGGSVCLFRARDGQVVRHSCALPVSG